MLRVLVLSFLVFVVVQLLRHAWAVPKPSQASRRPQPSSNRGSGREREPHVVLGVAADASFEDVRAAYQKLVQENHPDKVADMSAEIRELAERRTKEINAAYNELKKRR